MQDFHYIFYSVLPSFQISLIDRVHKIYNDTVWQDRAVNIEFLLFYGFVLLHLLVIPVLTRIGSTKTISLILRCDCGKRAIFIVHRIKRVSVAWVL